MFFNPWSGAFFASENFLGTFSPLNANGAVKENWYRIYQDMYEYAALYLAKNKIQGLGICLYAHDEVSKKALFEYGFGMRCKDSIRKLSDFVLDQKYDSELEFKELIVKEFPLIRDMRFALHEHLKKSPCLLQADSSDFQKWITKVEEGDRRTFVAIKCGEFVVYVDIADEVLNHFQVLL